MLNDKTPHKESINSMAKNFKILIQKLDILQPYIKKARDIIGDKDKQYDFIAFDINQDLKAKDMIQLFDINISNVVTYKSKQYYLRSPKSSNSLKGCLEILPIVEELERVFNIEYSNLDVSEQKEIFIKRKQLWEEYKFNFGEITNKNDHFQLKENEIIMAKELAVEISHVNKLIKLIENSTQEKTMKNKNLK